MPERKKCGEKDFGGIRIDAPADVASLIRLRARLPLRALLTAH